MHVTSRGIPAHAPNEGELTEFENKYVCECSLLAERGMFFSSVSSIA
jgi:hypothetical protein